MKYHVFNRNTIHEGYEDYYKSWEYADTYDEDEHDGLDDVIRDCTERTIDFIKSKIDFDEIKTDEKLNGGVVTAYMDGKPVEEWEFRIEEDKDDEEE